MVKIPSMRFSKTNWLNVHRHHCSSLITNSFKTMIIRDKVPVWTKYLEPLNTLNCDLGGDRVQNVLWRAHNFPVISKNVVILCGTNN